MPSINKIRYGGTDYDILGDELANMAEIDGYYENMSVGNAEQLASTVFTEDQTPYLFRTTGGSADVGDREYVDAIVGATVAWNQLVPNENSDFTNSVTDTRAFIYMMIRLNSSPYTSALTREISTVGKYAFVFTANYTGKTQIIHSGSSNNLFFYGGNDLELINGHKYLFSINFTGVDLSTVGGVTTKDTMLIDLTQMFGSTIADYIYGLETANAGAGVAWFKKLFPNMDAEYSDNGVTKKLRDYQPGTLISVGGVSAHKTVGFNAWDEEWEDGGINSSGVPSAGNNRIRSKNFIPVFSNTSYCITVLGDSFALYPHLYDADHNYIGAVPYVENTAVRTTPSNAHYMKFYLWKSAWTDYEHHPNICINLSWDGEKNGTYEPYVEHTYPLDSSLTLRGRFKLDSSNNLYADGDEYTPDGAVNRRYGIVDLGTLNWLVPGNGMYYTNGLASAIKHVDNAEKANVIMNDGKYDVITRSNAGYSGDVATSGYGVDVSGYFFVCDTNKPYADPASFKAAMSGVYLVYELATPTTETAEPYQQTQICDDFGTEEFVSTSPVPVGHNTRYAPNLRAKLEMSPDSPDGDGVYAVQQSNGENTYVSLGSTTVIQGILARLTALEGNTNEG